MELSFIEKIICDHAEEINSVFVFPTNISAQTWLERYLEILGDGSCAVEQFIAWDMFKSSAARSKMQDKKSIPAVMRKLFVSMLVAENSKLIRANKPPLFTTIILPEYESRSATFVKWITSILPGIASWEEKVSSQDYVEDAEDHDLRILGSRYKEFLERHQLFEPAWEKPPFESNGHHYYIFFPEIISDFSEYEKLLRESKDITVIAIPETQNQYDAVLTSESRSEIKNASLYIRSLAENEHIPWEGIAVSVPDMENYQPYLLREFLLRNIPFTVRTGKKLYEYQSGKLFSQIAECVSQSFSFSALTDLLLNKSLPWNNQTVISQLIDFGIRHNCVASWKEDEKLVDIWETTFKSPCGQNEELCYTFYQQLRRSLTALCGAKSFAEIRARYFAFKQIFFSEEFLPESDLVLSRCIRELMALVDIEESYPDVKPPDPYSFFIERLTEIDYLSQQKSRGVNIFPYKVSASAPFAAQIVIGSHQDALSAVFQQMKFLNRGKRDVLGIKEQDATEHFISLYKLNSMSHIAAFFCSEHTFSGYTAPHSLFNESGQTSVCYAQDFFASEFDASDNARPVLYSSQKKSFESWQAITCEDDTAILNPVVVQKIKERYTEQGHDGKYRVSSSLLKEYYLCGLRWLHKSILRTNAISVEPARLDPTVIGNVYHAVLKEFFDTLIAENDCVLPMPLESDDASGSQQLPQKYVDALHSSVEVVFSGFDKIQDNGETLSPFSATLLKTLQNNIEYTIQIFLLGFFDLFSGYAVKAVEKSISMNVDGNYYLKGFIDCILSDKDGNTVIVDFKKSVMPSRESCVVTETTDSVGDYLDAGLGDFQIPVYTLLAESKYPRVSTALFTRVTDYEKQVVVFGSITSNKTGATKPSKNSIVSRDSEQGELILNTMQDCAKRFVREIEDGNCTTIATDLSECFGCDFRELCRRTYDVARGVYEQHRN
jgi:hypothetical protein